MSTISKITKSILFTTLMAAAACSSGSSTEQASEQSFPESSTKRQAEDLTAVLPSQAIVAQPTPMDESIDAPEVAVEASAPEPTTFSGWMKRGRARFQAGELSGALADYEMAVENRPENQRVQIQLARTLLSMDQASKAREHAEIALEIDGASSLAWNTMGRVELAEGENEAAIASFERATEEDADNSYAWNNLGFVLIEGGLYDEAVAALEEATTGGTPKAYMWNNLGMAYEHQDQIEFARAAYRQAGDGGSDKALANFQRLEGVTSLIADSGEIEGEEPVEVAEALELVEPEPESSEVVESADASVALFEGADEGAEPVEVAEVIVP